MQQFRPAVQSGDVQGSRAVYPAVVLRGPSITLKERNQNETNDLPINPSRLARRGAGKHHLRRLERQEQPARPHQEDPRIETYVEDDTYSRHKKDKSPIKHTQQQRPINRSQPRILGRRLKHSLG